MPLVNFTLRPGINKEVTEYSGQGQWIDSDYVRFFQGFPQKMKGWEKFISTTLVGVVRAQHAWVSLNGTKYSCLATNRKLYVQVNGLAYDITPLAQDLTSQTSLFTTTNGSDDVTVTVSNHATIPGTFVTFSNITSLDTGNTSYTVDDFEQEFEVQSIVDTNNFIIKMPSSESGAGITTNADGDVAIQINPGPDFSTAGYGWGTDTWGSGGWGDPSTSSDIILDAVQWSLDTYGEDLVATQLNGGTYYWDTSANVDILGRAVLLSNSPAFSRFSLVSTPDRHLVLFGTLSNLNDTSTQDDLTLRFSNQEDIYTWRPTAENTAGALRIQDGSRIVGAVRSRGQIVVWTDTSVHSLQYIGPPFTFGLRQLGQNCGLIGPHAGIDLNGITYWMSKDAFYLFDGSVKRIDSTVDLYVFGTGGINPTASENCYVGHNGQFSEVIWFYVRGENNQQINACAVYNYAENFWWTGSLARTSWIDREVMDNPIGTTYSNTATATNETIQGLTPGASTVYIHEVGNDADGEPIMAYCKSGAVALQDGNDFSFIKKIIPDIQNQQGNLNIDFQFVNYPSDTASATTSSYSFTPTTGKVDVRGRGRHFTANVYSNTEGSSWRLGTIRFDIQPDGKR